MAGAMRKVGEYLGLVEQAEYDDLPAQAPRQQAAPVRAMGTVTEISRPIAVEEPQVSDFIGRIETITPRTYNDARTVGENYRSGIPVIMNLSDISDDDAKRLVDFAAGLVFAVRGSIHRVTAKVFLLAPASIAVSDEDKQAIAAGGFYNQS